MIRVTVGGSFKLHPDKVFSAHEHGHAAAVAKAIVFLAQEVLPQAIKQDHEMHDGGPPEKCFGCP